MYRTALALLVGLMLVGCGNTSHRAKAFYNVSVVDDLALCTPITELKSSGNRIWRIESKRDKQFQLEARRRGLTCGVGGNASAQVASVSTVSSAHYKSSVDFSEFPDATLCKNIKLYDNLNAIREAKRRDLLCNASNASNDLVATSSKDLRSTIIDKKESQISSSVDDAVVAVTDQFELENERKKRLVAEAELAALKAKQQQRQKRISADNKLPFIAIFSVSTNGPQGTIVGRVTDNTAVAELKIDGKTAPFGSSGGFVFNTYVPEGGVSINLEAIDLTGLSSSVSVRLDRKTAEAASFNFVRLNPLERRGVANPNALSLIVGVAEYKETRAAAVYADSDAKVFADYAAEKLGVDRRRIKTLVNDGADEKDVLLAAKRWLARGAIAGQSDIYIFFAGHGLASDDGEKMYLLPYDGAPELLDKTAILRDELFADIAAANPRSVTVFLDTCYSGTTRGPDMLIASRPIAIRVKEKAVPEGFTVMTAAAGDQTAKPLEEAKHGMFSYFLMKGMEGDADANQDNQITAGELHAYVQQNVIQQSSGSQTPELQGDADRVLVRFQ